MEVREARGKFKKQKEDVWGGKLSAKGCYFSHLRYPFQNGLESKGILIKNPFLLDVIPRPVGIKYLPHSFFGVIIRSVSSRHSRMASRKDIGHLHFMIFAGAFPFIVSTFTSWEEVA